MAHYTSIHWYTVMRRHAILPIIRVMKFFFLLTVACFIYWTSIKLWWLYPDIEYLNIVFFIFIFGILNYAFISLILSFIYYYYDLIVVYKDQIVMIKCSLILRDDIEIVDAYRIMKVDWYSRGFFANIFWYWNLIIEQQKDDVRTFHFVPKPYKILLIIKKQRDAVLEERKKKYIISEE
jgi:hypothetical protein